MNIFHTHITFSGEQKDLLEIQQFLEKKQYHQAVFSKSHCDGKQPEENAEPQDIVSRCIQIADREYVEFMEIEADACFEHVDEVTESSLCYYSDFRRSFPEDIFWYLSLMYPNIEISMTAVDDVVNTHLFGCWKNGELIEKVIENAREICDLTNTNKLNFWTKIRNKFGKFYDFIIHKNHYHLNEHDVAHEIPNPQILGEDEVPF